MKDTSRDLKVFLDACASGDPEACTAFQEAYGALIYTFPTRIYRLTTDDAGDFYVYVFENDRIFKRVRTFESRNAIQFETYLSYYVLRDLFLEWRRSIERLDMVSLDAPLAGSQADGEHARTVQDVLPAPAPTPAARLEESAAGAAVAQVLQQLEPEKRLVLKLLALGTMELTPEDVRGLAQIAGRSIRETLAALEEVGTALAAKAMKAEDKWQTLHTVGYWIQTYQHQIMSLQEQVQASRAQGVTRVLERWTHDQAELERKLRWRYEQQARLREELQKLDIRPSYKDIARLLNLPLGTICSRIARAREDFRQRLTAAGATDT